MQPVQRKTLRFHLVDAVHRKEGDPGHLQLRSDPVETGQIDMDRTEIHTVHRQTLSSLHLVEASVYPWKGGWPRGGHFQLRNDPVETGQKDIPRQMLTRRSNLVEAIHGKEGDPGHSKLRNNLVGNCRFSTGRAATDPNNKRFHLKFCHIYCRMNCTEFQPIICNLENLEIFFLAALEMETWFSRVHLIALAFVALCEGSTGWPSLHVAIISTFSLPNYFSKKLENSPKTLN